MTYYDCIHLMDSNRCTHPAIAGFPRLRRGLVPRLRGQHGGHQASGAFEHRCERMKCGFSGFLMVKECQMPCLATVNASMPVFMWYFSGENSGK